MFARAWRGTSSQTLVNEVVRQHLTVIVAACLLGIAVTSFALLQIHDAAGSMDASTFSLAIFVVPCVVMVVCSFIIMFTANAIGRQLFVVVVGICFVAGIVSMVVTSGWLSNELIVSQLLANSPDGTTVTPPVQSIIVVMRDIAAFIVAPTVGSIAGAWFGSRLHPIERA